MDFQESNFETSYYIRAYESGRLYINAEVYERPLFIFQKQLEIETLPASFEALTAAHVEDFTKLQPELLLLGTGKEQKFPEHTLLVPLIKRQIGFEVMNTASAARTFNILAEEGRKVLGVFFV